MNTIFHVRTSFLAPGPVATTVPRRTFACAFSGNTIPPFVLVIASALCIRTLSNRGINLFTAFAAA